jgi:hypothetical protein
VWLEEFPTAGQHRPWQHAVRGAHKTIPTNNHIDMIANILYFMYLYMLLSLCFFGATLVRFLGSRFHVVSLFCAIKILHLKNLTHDAALIRACDMDNDIHGFSDQALDHPAWSVRIHRH